MNLILPMSATARRGSIPGVCAGCAKPVYESLFTLDDAYNVWVGQCPHCRALNMLSMDHGLRGYCSTQMWLELPTDEERDANVFPADTPTRGAALDAGGTR